jgi:hypothetical protein
MRTENAPFGARFLLVNKLIKPPNFVSAVQWALSICVSAVNVQVPVHDRVGQNDAATLQEAAR